MARKAVVQSTSVPSASPSPVAPLSRSSACSVLSLKSHHVLSVYDSFEQFAGDDQLHCLRGGNDDAAREDRATAPEGDISHC